MTMNTKYVAALILVSMPALFSPPKADAQSKLDALVGDNTTFALDLYHKLAPTEGNLFFSPHSISTALAMTYAGARGKTETEMAETLHFSLGQTELHPAFKELEARLRTSGEAGTRLCVANSLWPQKDYAFLGDYLSLIEENYGTLITAVDYRSDRESARQTINQWVENATEHKIKDILQPRDLKSLTRLVLVNVICFKGTWATQFAPKNTEDATFHVTFERAVQTPMMRQKITCRYASLPSLDVLELPYTGGGVSMIILLPKKIGGLQQIEATLSKENMAKWLGALSTRDVLVFLPRFKTMRRFNLSGTLASMGMVDAFSETSANFAGMDGRPDWLYISALIHKAFVEVNEEGTEAAAATAVVMSGRSVPAQPLVFRADHPFVFLIQETQTGCILFAGRVSDPTVTGE